MIEGALQFFFLVTTGEKKIENLRSYLSETHIDQKDKPNL